MRKIFFSIVVAMTMICSTTVNANVKKNVIGMQNLIEVSNKIARTEALNNCYSLDLNSHFNELEKVMKLTDDERKYIFDINDVIKKEIERLNVINGIELRKKHMDNIIQYAHRMSYCMLDDENCRIYRGLLNYTMIKRGFLLRDGRFNKDFIVDKNGYKAVANK